LNKSIVKIILLILIGVFFSLFFMSLVNFYNENKIIKEVANNIDLKDSNHVEIIHMRDDILKKYINSYTSEAELKGWQQNRSILRQSASETILGKTALCGEFTRVMVKLLRQKDIKARRLYLFGKPGSSHVLFEYYNNTDSKWYIVNSFASIKYVNDIFNINKISVDTLYNQVDIQKFKYNRITSLNHQMTKIFPLGFELPYFISYFLDEIYLILMVLNLFLLSITYLLYRRFR
jgi:hypothetical protein